MEKVKEKLHLRRKSKPENDASALHKAAGEEHRASVDSELEAMSPSERVAYLKEFDDAERAGEPKKGSLIDKLIARGNKRTEDQLAKEHADRQAALGTTGGAPAGTASGGVVR